MLSHSRLTFLFTYDPITGMFTRKTSRGGYKIGSIAGNIDGEYLRIVIDKKIYLAHRLAWFYQTGIYPEKIDHEDHNGTNNIFTNLRNVSHAENMKNKKLHKNNTSGTVGVYWHKNSNRWMSSICVDKKTKHLGYFNDINDAIKIRKEAEIKYGFHKNHGKEKK